MNNKETFIIAGCDDAHPMVFGLTGDHPRPPAINESDFATAQVVPVLPAYFGIDRGDALPADLVGAQIVRFGTFENSSIEGGGLVIDYRRPETTVTHRVVFAFNELGMWVEWAGEVEGVG